MEITDQVRATVVKRARAQIGKSYRFGGTGPAAYDCSGSALASWQEFLTLPHNTGEMIRWFQVGMRQSTLLLPGKHLGKSARSWMKPGDLVFYYGKPSDPDTVSHCAVYVGMNTETGLRQVVNATNAERGVELINLSAYASPVAYGLINHAPGAK